MWVLLVEKAWAKLNGCYEKTIKGVMSEALRALTGAPCEVYNHDFEHDLWKKIQSSDKKKYVMCASSGIEDEDAEIDDKE
jgi:hypothetical protein